MNFSLVTNARSLMDISALAYDSAGQVWSGDNKHGQICVWDESGTLITKFENLNMTEPSIYDIKSISDLAFVTREKFIDVYDIKVRQIPF